MHQYTLFITSVISLTFNQLQKKKTKRSKLPGSKGKKEIDQTFVINSLEISVVNEIS